VPGVVLHQPREPPEEGAGVHLLHLRGRRGLRVDTCGHRHLGGRGVGLAPGRERRQLVLLLQRVDHRIVLRSVCLHLPVDPYEPRRGLERLLDIGGRRALPAGPRDQEVRRTGPGVTLADRGEHVAPHVEQRDDVIAPVGVRHGEHQRLLVQIRPGRREQGVETGPHHRPERGVRVLRHDGELIDGRRDLSGSRHRCRRVLGEVHHDQRKAVDVRFQAVQPCPAFLHQPAASADASSAAPTTASIHRCARRPYVLMFVVMVDRLLRARSLPSKPVVSARLPVRRKAAEPGSHLRHASHGRRRPGAVQDRRRRVPGE